MIFPVGSACKSIPDLQDTHPHAAPVNRRGGVAARAGPEDATGFTLATTKSYVFVHVLWHRRVGHLLLDKSEGKSKPKQTWSPGLPQGALSGSTGLATLDQHRLHRLLETQAALKNPTTPGPGNRP